MNCTRPGCTGQIDDDGYCDVCGLAPPKERPAASSATEVLSAQPASAPIGFATSTASRSRGSATTSTRRGRLGAGLVEIPPVPARDPSTAVMADPQVAEHRRFCSRCNEPVGRSRDEIPGRTEGFCRKCGHPFSFTPKLAPGTMVGGQYEVVGCLAHGGMGWVYLARDHRLEHRWVVLKGLLDTADPDAMTAAVAERRFLAAVKHPNIVEIHNFVEHGNDGYIVMEYVDGTSLRDHLEARREANAGRPDPLPVDQAIAYILEILPALGYLHDLGLAYCDFKPDNVIQTPTDVELIDLGGVYRMDDESSPVYGTVGYQAPEIAQTGPTVASDLFTVGRTLAVLCTDFRGYQSTYRYTLPAREDVRAYAECESLYRFLQRATASHPDHRFQNADEMAAQLLGVLREVVAATTGAPAPGPSTLFTGEGRGANDVADWHALPYPLVATDDAAAGFLAALAGIESDEAVEMLRGAPQHTVEVDLRLARTLIESDRFDEADEALAAIATHDPNEWRAAWYRGLLALAEGDADAAQQALHSVYHTLPGELAPKLALAYAAERAGDPATAAGWYEIVARTDPAYTSASFGLARCRLALGDRAAAIAAHDRVPERSNAFVDAQIAKARLLLDAEHTGRAEVLEAAGIVDRLALDREQRARLGARVLEVALEVVSSDPSANGSAAAVLGHPFTERGIRLGLEATYRALARQASTTTERIALVDLANRTRPRSLL